MTLNTRSAWREQWLLIILAVALFLLPLLPWLEINPSPGNLKITAMLEAPFLIVFLIIIGRHYSRRFTVQDSGAQHHAFHLMLRREGVIIFLRTLQELGELANNSTPWNMPAKVDCCKRSSRTSTFSLLGTSTFPSGNLVRFIPALVLP